MKKSNSDLITPDQSFVFKEPARKSYLGANGQAIRNSFTRNYTNKGALLETGPIEEE